MWRNAGFKEGDNPWAKKAISYLTKNPKINPEIAFFRLRDYAF